jgi:hypothetical protein
VKMLQQYLRARAEGTGISHLDLMKLWKVRWCNNVPCVYMCAIWPHLTRK